MDIKRAREDLRKGKHERIFILYIHAIIARKAPHNWKKESAQLGNYFFAVNQSAPMNIYTKAFQQNK